MTDQEMCITIAECCGIFVCRGCNHEIDPSCCGCGDRIDHFPDGHHPVPMGCTCGYSDATKRRAPQPCCPNYTSDLNAMHEAEKVFDDQPVDTKSMYWDYLCLCSMPEPFPGDDSFLRDYVMIRATARQRAEAFLRTLGKWKE